MLWITFVFDLILYILQNYGLYQFKIYSRWVGKITKIYYFVMFAVFVVIY